jgi:hypothetical protein
LTTLWMRWSWFALSGPALQAQAQAQADLSVAGEVITPTSEPERWLGGTDPCVLELFAKAPMMCRAARS